MDFRGSIVFFLVLLFQHMCGFCESTKPVTCVTNAYPPAVSTEIETHIVNLDLEPQQRWKHIVAPKKNELIDLLNDFKSLIGEKGLKYVDYIFSQIDSWLPHPYKEEIDGIASAAGLPVGEAILYNIFYELFSVCTSIVAQDESGKLYHARNLDFGLLMGWDVKNNTWLVTEKLRKLMVNVDYQRNGKTVFKSVHFVGYIGVLTAVKQNAFTLTMNERFTLNGGYVGIIKWVVDHAKSKAKWSGFLTRDVMENATSYEEAKKMLSDTELIAPVYFILGGAKSGEGCIITRDRVKTADTWRLSDANSWYLVETNYDHWKTPFFLDDRRAPAKQCMNEMTQKSLGFKGLFNILSTIPVLNKLTSYTALMQVNEGSLEAYSQDCTGSCWPW